MNFKKSYKEESSTGLNNEEGWTIVICNKKQKYQTEVLSLRLSDSVLNGKRWRSGYETITIKKNGQTRMY